MNFTQSTISLAVASVIFISSSALANEELTTEPTEPTEPTKPQEPHSTQRTHGTHKTHRALQTRGFCASRGGGRRSGPTSQKFNFVKN